MSIEIKRAGQTTAFLQFASILDPWRLATLGPGMTG
jgi:hypothetical protein